jgi:hypothetical protein
MMMMMDKSNRHGKASGALFSSGTEDRAREGRRRRGRGDRVPAPASTRTFFFARPSATSRLFHSPMRAWGGTERGRVRAARASLGTSAFGRGATRERATSISARPKRCRPRARAEKRRLSSRSHSVRADASGVSASRLAEMGGDHRGGKRHRHGVRGPYDPRRAAFCDTPRAVDREIPPRRLPPIHPIRATRKHSMSRALDRRPVALVTSFPLTTSSPVFSHTFSPPYTRRRMAVTTAAAAAAGSALPR